MPAKSKTDLRLQEKSLNSILIALSIGGAALVLLREINYGVGLGSDSRDFVATARNLLDGNWFTTWDGEVVAKNVPLFPTVLASLGLFGLEIITAGAFVNILAFGMIIFITTFWLKRYVRSHFLIIWAGCAIALWVPLADISATVMTDPLFILLAILSLYTIDRAIVANTQSMVIVSAACVSLAWLTRYQGIAVALTAFMLISVHKGFTFQRKAKYVAIYAAIIGVPMAGWITHNLILTGTLAGNREGYILKYQDSLIWDYVTSELIYWTIGGIGSEYLTKLSEIILGINETEESAILYKSTFLLIIASSIGFFFKYTHRRGLWDNLTTVAIVVSFTLIYTVVTLIPPLLQYEVLAIRYLLPLYIPILVTVVLILDKLIRLPSLPRWMPVAVTTILSLWIVQHIPDNYRNIDERINDGSGAASRIWERNNTLRYLEENPLNGRIYSTSHWVPYFKEVCVEQCTLLPLRFLRDEEGRLIDPRPADEPLYIMILQQEDYYSSLIELTELPALEIISINLDGIILKLAPDGADIEKSLLLGQDMIVDMVRLNPDRFDGRRVLEEFSPELR